MKWWPNFYMEFNVLRILLLDHKYLLGPPKFSPVAKELCRAHPRHLKANKTMFALLSSPMAIGIMVPNHGIATFRILIFNWKDGGFVYTMVCANPLYYIKVDLIFCFATRYWTHIQLNLYYKVKVKRKSCVTMVIGYTRYVFKSKSVIWVQIFL